MRCPECGEDNRPGALICGLCKALFGRPAAPSRPPAPPPSGPWASPSLSLDGPPPPTSGFRIPAAPPPTRSPAPLWGIALTLFLVAGVGAAYRRHHNARRAAPAPAPLAHQDPAPPRARPAPAVTRPVAVIATQPPAPAPAPFVEEAPALPPPSLSVSSYWYEGAEGYRRAQDEQRGARAPMLIYFRVDWCPYCRQMDREALTAPAVVRFLGGVVKVRVNVESSPAERALAAQFGVHGYPSVFVIPGPGATPKAVPHFSRTGNEDISISAEKFVEACREVGLEQSRELVREAADKWRAGDRAGAGAALDRALELDPGNAVAFRWRGFREAEAGDSGKAAGDLKRAIELDPKDPYAYTALAQLYLRAGQVDQGIDTLSRLTEAAPDWRNGMAFALRGDARGHKGDRAGAAADHAEACRRGHAPSCR
jgi:thioredoxin-like negative regulator of GroEL